jgi:Domain of unknown function (DUF6456)
MNHPRTTLKQPCQKENAMLKPIYSEAAVPGDAQTAANSRVRSVRLNLAESPLGWLRARGKVTDRQFAGGELLRADYERAQLAPRVTMNWGAPPLGRGARGAPDPAGAAHRIISAKARFDGAITTAGPGLSDILWRVICAGESVPSAERALGWPVRAGRLVLTLALDRVADYYGVK